MSQPVGRREFFALEAGEYLERLAQLAQSPGTPEGALFVRHARALRGAALMAGPAGFSLPAAALENLAKAVRDGSLAWTPILADRVADALEECKALLRVMAEWADLEISRCERLAGGLDALVGSGGRPQPSSPGGGGAPSAGVRAYVAREAATVATALEQLALAVERLPTPDAAAPLLHRLQPLRGLGALPELSPLPELVEALELTIAAASRGEAWPPGAFAALRAASGALTRMARDIAELGMPQADSHEVVFAAEQLREVFAREDDIVPITSLAAEGDHDFLVARGTPPPVPAAAADLTVELVSIADRLRQAGTQALDASGRATRILQLHVLVIAFRGLAMSPVVREAVGPLLCRLDREAMAGRAAEHPEVVGGILRSAAEAIAAAAAADTATQLGEALAAHCRELDRLGGTDAPPADPVVPIASLAPDEESEEAGVVPISALLYDAVPDRDYTPFEQSFATLFRLQAAAADPIVPIAALAPDPETDIVPVATLLYRGRRALERADTVRRELQAVLQHDRDAAAVERLLGELLDLVPLALDDAR